MLVNVFDPVVYVRWLDWQYRQLPGTVRSTPNLNLHQFKVIWNSKVVRYTIELFDPEVHILVLLLHIWF